MKTNTWSKKFRKSRQKHRRKDLCGCWLCMDSKPKKAIFAQREKQRDFMQQSLKENGHLPPFSV